MTRAIQFLAPLLAAALALPAAAMAELPPGLASAELLPAYPTGSGSWMTALRIDLEPGWKTYWRSPGDTGVPPAFDWAGVSNLSAALPRWPAPQIIESAGERALGYHDTLILPIEITPATPGAAIAGRVGVELGLCENICVPALLSLDVPSLTDRPDPQIEAALARVPVPQTGALSCVVTEIEDGLQVAASVAAPAGEGTAAAALELDRPEVWVSSPELASDGGRVTATADFVAPSGEPFALERSEIRLTLVDAQGAAVEYQGCDPA